MSSAWKSLVVVCVLASGMYAYTAPLGRLESLTSNSADEYYNLLVQGFRDGHLSVKKEVPAGFARLADPYDPAANRLYRGLPDNLSDLSYYKGRFYLYFGVTPALISFWPSVALTGHYLFDRAAVTIFCAVGITVGLGLLRALWRRYFAEVSVGVVATCALALGLATGVPTLLPQSGIYQVVISCGYMLTMLALGGIWCAVHEPERGWRWLAVASAAYGLAVGARPNLLFGGIILLVPVAQAWRERRRVGTLLMAAMGPIILIGLGLMLYNDLRFDNPLEFGPRYQLAGERHATLQFFSWHYVWFNFRVYFLGSARWSTAFPFVREITTPPAPGGHTNVQDPFGLLANVPLVWLALAVPLAWRKRSGQERGPLRWFVVAVCLLFGMCALILGFYCSAAGRYEVEFLPALVLLAVVGILGLERALAPTSESGRADRPVWRRAVRWGWSLLLGLSVVFNVLVSVENYAYAGSSLGTMLVGERRVPEAIQILEKVLRIEPDYADAHYSLGQALWQAGQRRAAIGHYERALRINPDLTDAHVDLGIAMSQLGRSQEALAQFMEALRLLPNSPEVHNNVGNALDQMGRVPEAIGHFEEALRIRPDYADAHYNLGQALGQAGQLRVAIGHYEQALRIRPDFTEAHVHLGIALLQLGSNQEALAQFREALRLRPSSPEVHNNLGRALFQAGRMSEAMEHWERALQIRPDYAEAHINLGIALMRSGKFPEAAGQWEQVVRLKPADPEAHDNLGVCREKTGQVCEGIAQYEEALRLKPDLTTAQNDLAWALATHTPAEGGDPVRAVTLAQEACERVGTGLPTYLDTLAAAYAAAGRFSDAIATAEKAIDLARAGGQPNLAARIEARLELYRRGHTYRQSVGEAEPHTP